MELSEHIQTIIEKHFQGRESAEERRLLEEWRGQHPDHENEFRELMLLWTESGHILNEPAFDTAGAWKRLDERLNGKKKLRVAFSFRTLAAAAVMAGVLLLAGWLLFQRDHRNLQMAVAKTGNVELSLPDGSKVTLRKGSSLQYPTVFKGEERKVVLNGDAFFDVKADDNQPFRIHTERSVIQVLGTSFLVHTGNNEDRVVVASGKVLFTDKKEPDQHCVLSARQEALLGNKGFEQQNVNDSNYLSWQTGVLQFERAGLDRVAKDLSDHFGVPVLLDTTLEARAGELTVTASFREQPLEQVLGEIAALTGLQYRRQNDTVIIFQP